MDENTTYDSTGDSTGDTTYDRDPGTVVTPLGDRSGRHPLNVAHLVMGIAFLGFVGIWATIAGEVVDSDDVRWLLPVPWVLAGAAGLLAIAFGGRRSRGRQDW